MSWPEYHRATEADRAERRVAISLAALVLYRWALDYELQRPELRKRKMPSPGEPERGHFDA